MPARSDIHALVAGVNLYLPCGGHEQSFPPLYGCVDDARDLASYLVSELEVPPEQVRLLTCSGPGPAPDEPEERQPTYTNLVTVLRELATKARPGDQVLFYFAGHGTRIPTLIPEAKGAGESDECLVPADARKGANLLRDIEIAALVARMAAAGLQVNLFLDCCHSGGALKAPGDEVGVRGLLAMDVQPQASAVASREELAASWLETAGRPPAAAVLLAACRPGELALEALLKRRKRGVFTWALLEGLRRLGPGIGYRRLHERVLGNVRNLFEIQTPFLDGNGERVVLGGEPRRPQPTVTVLAVLPGQNEVLLAAGAPLGVGVGARFAIYPADLETEELRAEDRIAVVEVNEAGAATSSARVVQIFRPEVPLETGAPAVLLSLGGERPKRRVAVAALASPLIDAAIGKLAGDPTASGFVETARPGDVPDFWLVADDGGAAEILDAAGTSLFRSEASADPGSLIAALEHLSRYRSVRELSNQDPASDLAGGLQVSLDRLARPWQPGRVLELVPFSSSPATVRPDDWLCLTIENCSRRELNVAVLNLQADWSVTQAWPAGAYFPLGSGRREHIPYQVLWPFRQPQGLEHLKIFGSAGPVELRPLELPALGSPLPGHRAYRGLAPEGQPQHEWTVVDLLYVVRRDGR